MGLVEGVMARPVMLSNGSLMVGLNEHGLVHDFYYPYVGLENLTTARSIHHMIGVWVDGSFSWVDDGSWQTTVDFETDALISNITMHSDELQISLSFQDFVDSDVNAFCRNCTVTNLVNHSRDIRIFMHQVFEISRGGRADTAMYEPEENYILDYKGRCSLLIYAQNQHGQVYDQFAIGNYGIEGKQGTFKDAEDGDLSGSPIEHGGVDSVIRFLLPLEAGAQTTLDYWIIAADSQYVAEKIHQTIKTDGLKKRQEQTRTYWHDWMATGSNKLHGIDSQYLTAVKKSLLVIKSHIDKRGGVIASCDSSIYNYGRDYYSYVWPRDGAYALWPLIRMGFKDEAKRFFAFCRDIMNPDGYLMHKYQPDRAIGSTWHPMLHGNHKELAIQEDETAIVIYMLGEYVMHIGDDEFVRSLYTTLIQPAANFMAEFIDPSTDLPHASYDLWEEKFLTNTYTAAVTYQALLVAADFADKYEYPDDAVSWRRAAERILTGSTIFFDPDRKLLRKGYLLQADDSLSFDNTLDVSSMYGVVMFGLHGTDKTELDETLHAIENILLNQSPSGGAPRYEHDNYFKCDPAYMGNPWFVTTLWLAQFYILSKQTQKAHDILDWVQAHALNSGVLSEQVNPSTGEIISVTPLVWSHAELINTVLDLAKIA
ncbi:MAG: glycoside hydrolase family 15 protein [Candidatus Saccharimonadales bacterium]